MEDEIYDYERQHQEDLERIKNFRLLDDDYMTKFFEGNYAATELVLNIILNLHLTVLQVTTQATIKNLQGRSVRLDILAADGHGKRYNIEVQRQDKGAGAKRARYHSSILDANLLLSGEEYDQLPETYVIFITESDVLKKGKPIYMIERCVLGNDGVERFNDGSHILYVNSEIQDNTDLGRLMHDFHCTDPGEMHYNILADRARYFKESEEGVATMCKAMEEMRNEAVLRKCKQLALERLAEGELTHEQIAKFYHLTLEQVKKLASEKSA